MFSDSFLAGKESSSQPEAQARPTKSPLATLEEWRALEGVAEWPCPDPSENEESIDPDSLLGSQDEIERYMKTNAAWSSEYLERVDRRLCEIEKSVETLCSLFLWGPLDGDHDRDPAFLTELCEHISMHQMRRTKSMAIQACAEKTLESVVYPGAGEECTAVPLPNSLHPHQLMDLVTTTLTIPVHVNKIWKKVCYSESFCHLVQNTFWYVFLKYLNSETEKEEISRLFSIISGNYMSLHMSISDQKYKDEVFILLPECLAKTVYSTFCHVFPKSSKIFNSDDFLMYVTDLTYEWITGVVSPLGSWKKWPRHILDPHFNTDTEDSSPPKIPLSKSRPLTEKDVMKLSIKNKQRSIHLRGNTAMRKQGRSSKSQQKTPTINIDTHEEVGVGEGPTFESLPFGLRARSPLLQNYLVTHGFEEREDVQRALGPVITRTRISQLPPPSMTYQELLKCSREDSRKNYNQFDKVLDRTEQEISSNRKKHNALVRASERRTERLLQHKYKVAIMAERIMNKYASKSIPINQSQQ